MQRVKRRIIGGLSGLGLAAGVLGATAGPAGAQAGFDMTCTARPDSNLCIYIDPMPDNHYLVHVGIDVHMTQQRAQEFIDTNGGNPFQVKVYGPDHFSTDLLFEVPMTGVGASAESGLSGDFDLVVLHWQLDEDDNFLDNDDEIFAVVTVRQEVPYPETFDYYSNQLSHEY